MRRRRSTNDSGAVQVSVTTISAPGRDMRDAEHVDALEQLLVQHRRLALIDGVFVGVRACARACATAWSVRPSMRADSEQSVASTGTGKVMVASIDCFSTLRNVRSVVTMARPPRIVTLIRVAISGIGVLSAAPCPEEVCEWVIGQ